MSTAQAVAVVTGASRGIGAALVQAFRRRNYRIVATSRSIKSCRDEDLVTVQGDVADPNTANLVFKEALDRFGRVDTLVNNAGIFIAKSFTSYSNDDYASYIATNVTGFFHMTQRAMALARATGNWLWPMAMAGEFRRDQRRSSRSMRQTPPGWTVSARCTRCRVLKRRRKSAASATTSQKSDTFWLVVLKVLSASFTPRQESAAGGRRSSHAGMT